VDAVAELFALCEAQAARLVDTWPRSVGGWPGDVLLCFYTGWQCFMYCPIQQEDFGGVRFPLLADVRALFEPFARSHPPSPPPEEFELHRKLSVAP